MLFRIRGQEISFFVQEVTGTDTQFDAEVDADSPGGSSVGTDSSGEVLTAVRVGSCR